MAALYSGNPMSVKTDCPKCGSTAAWYEKSHYDLTLRCTCGYHKVVLTTLEQMEIQHNDGGDDIKLPRKATHLWATLMVLTTVDVETSVGITTRLRELKHPFSVSDVSSYLTILRAKGLVDSPERRRGIAGGSSWRLTDPCKRLLGM
jgi:hypothetical protein